MLGAVDTVARKETEAWRAKHEADYRREYVPLAGLFPLKAGPNTGGKRASNSIVLPKAVPAVDRPIRVERQNGDASSRRAARR